MLDFQHPTYNDSVIINDSNSGVSIVNIKCEISGISRLRRISVSSNIIDGRYSCILLVVTLVD